MAFLFKGRSFSTKICLPLSDYIKCVRHSSRCSCFLEFPCTALISHKQLPMDFILKEYHHKQPASQTVFFSTTESDRPTLEKQPRAPLNILFTQPLLIEGGICFQEIMKKQKPTHCFTYIYSLTHSVACFSGTPS